MTERLCRVYVEIPVGGGVRIRCKINDSSPTKEESFPGLDIINALAICAYGCIPGTLNPADSDAVDAVLLNAYGIKAGYTVDAVVMGIYMRCDGDHKILVTPSNDLLAAVDTIDSLPKNVLTLIGRWGETMPRPSECWLGVSEALEFISRCKV